MADGPDGDENAWYLLGGITVMALAIGMAAVWYRLAPAPPDDVDPTDDLDPDPVRVLGEQALGLVARWPAAACAAATLLGAAGAYAHAEAGRASSLGWAALEAAAVVAGWLTLARPLGLRAGERTG